MFEALRAAVRAHLENPHSLQWTVQGFGMLRTYFPTADNPKRFRLNIWSTKLAVPGVSIMHDHPWDFDSWIINGRFDNVRYAEINGTGNSYKYMIIKCGEEGCALSDPTRIKLLKLPTEHYTTGDTYHQDAHEIHASYYDDGTVTLNSRVGDTEQARVFWRDEPKGYWVDAKPRRATWFEVADTCVLALRKWE